MILRYSRPRHFTAGCSRPREVVVDRREPGPSTYRYVSRSLSLRVARSVIREEPARAERRHAFVEFMTGRFDRIARGSNNARRNVSPPRRGTAARRTSNGNSVDTRSGFRSHRPPRAELNQRESTTESSDDATYGRSLTYWSSAPPCRLGHEPCRPDRRREERPPCTIPHWPPGRRPSRCRTGTPACARAPGACGAGIRDRWRVGGSFEWLGACAYGSGRLLSSIPRRACPYGDTYE